MTTPADLPPEILDMITKCLPVTDHIAFSRTCRRMRKFVPPCEMEWVKLEWVDCWRFFKCPPKISIWLFYISWFFIEYLWFWIFSDFLPLSCFHFSPFYLFSVCWLAFVFWTALIYWPYVFAQSNPGYRFFKAAKIKHLVLSEHFRFHIGNLEALSILLTGCNIDKITFIVDKVTDANLCKVHEFFALIRVKKVVFNIPKGKSQSELTLTMRDEFSVGLALAGIEEITFSSCKFYDSDRERLDRGFGRLWSAFGRILTCDSKLNTNEIENGVEDKSAYLLDLLVKLFNAGIKSVIVNINALTDRRTIVKHELDTLLRKTAALKKNMSLVIHCQDEIMDGTDAGSRPLPKGSYRSDDDEELGRTVEINYYSDSVTIVYLSTQPKAEL